MNVYWIEYWAIILEQVVHLERKKNYSYYFHLIHIKFHRDRRLNIKFNKKTEEDSNVNCQISSKGSLLSVKGMGKPAVENTR